MKKILFLIAVVTIAFMQCTPKTTEKATSGKDKMEAAKDKVEEVVKKPTFRSMPPEPGPAPKIQLGSYESFKMKNGLEVIVVENHKIPRVSFQVFVDVPLFSEGESAGLSDMAGDLISRGTNSKSKAQIDEEIDFIGASLNTSSRGLFASSLKKHSDKLLSIVADVLFNPAFSQEEFDKVKKQTLSGLESSKDDPNSISQNVSQVLRYGKDHPYGEIVTEETVNNITLEQCKKYYNTYFSPENAYLVIVGDITPDEAKVMSDQFFSKWKSKGMLKPVGFKMPKAPDATQVSFVNKPGAVQSVISVTYPVELKPGSDDAIKSSMMNSIFGGFFGSYLNQNLREDKAYTYGARSSLRSDKEVGSFSAGASVRNEVTDSALVEINKEMRRVLTEKLSDEDLSLVKNYMSGNFARSLERPQTIARFALNTARYNLPTDYYNTYLEKVDAVTKEDIMAMANKYMRPENAHIVVVGNKDEVAEKLGAFSSNGQVDYYDYYGEEVEMDDTVLPDGITAETVLSDYINAIGGKEKLMGVKDITIISTTEIQGMALTNTMVKKEGGKFLNEMSAAGMGTMQKQVFDGEKGSVTAMGQNKPMTDEEVAKMKNETAMFEELDYAANGTTTELKGVEPVDGVKAYKILVTSADGTKKTSYYDMSTSLKIREISTQGEQTITTDMSDYKEVDGIKIAHLHAVSGVMGPMVLKLATQEVKINSGVEDSVFE